MNNSPSGGKMGTFIKNKKDVKRAWWIVDASKVPLGRLASEVAAVLRGKNKPDFTPHVDSGDFVICINADKVLLTGKKEINKKYYRYSGFIGGLKEITLKRMKAKKPEEIIYHAVRGMLPKNRLSKNIIKKLKVYPGSKHPHTAQNPQPLQIGGE